MSDPRPASRDLIKLTDRQVEDLLGRLHITEFETRDEQEVAGYAYVMDQVFVMLTNGKPSTVKLSLKELVKIGYLVPKGHGRGVHYLRKT